MKGTPFRHQGPVPPSLLIDRQDELRTMGRRAADRVGVRLAAPRRYGKTSLLNAHAESLRAASWHTVHIDCSRTTDMGDLARRIVRAYARLDVAWLRGRLGALRPQLGISLATDGTVSLAGGLGQAGPEAAEDAVYRLLDLPLALAERTGEPTLVAFDEFQDLLTARDDLDGLLRSRVQHHGDAAAYVYAGSEPSLMRALFETRERPLYGQAQPLALGPLDEVDLVDALVGRFAGEGLDPGEVLGEIVAFGHGHPQRTMLMGYCLAERLGEGRAASLEQVVDDALASTGPAHEALWDAIGRLERLVLAAVAAGSAPVGRGLAQEHRVSRNGLARAAGRLADAGHLARHGERDWSLIDPLLGAWLRRGRERAQ